jgi:hypothetical protein
MFRCSVVKKVGSELAQMLATYYVLTTPFILNWNYDKNVII